MLLRLSLGIAIVAGLAALYFSHVNVAEKITSLGNERDSARAAEAQANSAAQQARNNEKKARQDLDLITQQLADQTTKLEDTASDLAEQRKRADQLMESWTQATRERNLAQQELARFLAAGIPPEQIVKLRDQLAGTAQARDAYASENQLLNRRVEVLELALARYEGETERPVDLPEGLKGQVVAVDPRYDFVVLNIGERDGVKEDGQLLVNRGGQLIARLRVTRVEPNRSIANVIPEWKQDEVMEGDLVFY